MKNLIQQFNSLALNNFMILQPSCIDRCVHANICGTQYNHRRVHVPSDIGAHNSFMSARRIQHFNSRRWATKRFKAKYGKGDSERTSDGTGDHNGITRRTSQLGGLSSETTTTFPAVEPFVASRVCGHGFEVEGFS
jgi:hypothetical protein